MKTYYVYIVSNRRRTVLYTGVTGDLARRMGEHRAGVGSRFASWYRARELVYYEAFPTAEEAIAREKAIKRWRRAKKDALIRVVNPTLQDLAQTMAW